MKIKTQFWETIDTKKVAKLMFFLLIMSMTNVIFFSFTNYLLMLIINLIPTTILTLIVISHQKYEGQQYQKEKEKDNGKH